MYLEDESHSYHISSLMDRKMKGEKLDGNLVKGRKRSGGSLLCGTEAKRRPACCVRIINHRGREVRPYPQKAKRGDSASDNSEGRRETHFVARL